MLKTIKAAHLPTEQVSPVPDP